MWFDELKRVLPRYYLKRHPLNIVGYLRGAGGPNQWRVSALIGRNQAIILGNEPPTQKDWTEAGFTQRKRHQHAILIQNISGWIVLQNGGSDRPWGQLIEIEEECLSTGFPKSLEYWKRNFG